LVVKAHPWDPGLRHWRSIVGRLAVEFGVGERVDYLAGGDLDELLRSAPGLVTVNSSVGLRALRWAARSRTWARSIYDLPGFCHQGALEAFWRQAHAGGAPGCGRLHGRHGRLDPDPRGLLSRAGLERRGGGGAERLYAGTVGTISCTTTSVLLQ